MGEWQDDRHVFQTAYANYFHCTGLYSEVLTEDQVVSNRLRELFSLHPNIEAYVIAKNAFQTAYANYFHCTSFGCAPRKSQWRVSNRLRELFSLHTAADLLRKAGPYICFKPLTRIIFTARVMTWTGGSSWVHGFKPLTRIIFTAQARCWMPMVVPMLVVSNRLRELFSLHPGNNPATVSAQTQLFQTAYANYFHCTGSMRSAKAIPPPRFKPLTRIIFTARGQRKTKKSRWTSRFKPLTRIIFTALGVSGNYWRTDDWFQTAYANYFHCTSAYALCWYEYSHRFKPLTRIIFTAHVAADGGKFGPWKSGFKPLTRIIFTAPAETESGSTGLH